jgi:hypothetical protein
LVEICAVLNVIQDGACGCDVEILDVSDAPDGKGSEIGGDYGDVDEVMLVGVVKLAENPQGIVSRLRLQSLDDCDRTLADSGYLLGAFLTPIFSETWVDGKGRVLTGSLPVRYHQLVDEVIESRSGIVNNVACAESPVHPKFIGNDSIDALFSRIRVEMDLDSVLVRLRAPEEIGFKLTEMFLSPPNLGIDAVRGMPHDA